MPLKLVSASAHSALRRRDPCSKRTGFLSASTSAAVQCACAKGTCCRLVSALERGYVSPLFLAKRYAFVMKETSYTTYLSRRQVDG